MLQGITGMLKFVNYYFIGINIFSFLLFTIDRIIHDHFDRSIGPSWLFMFVTILGGSIGTNLYFILFFPKFRRAGAPEEIAKPAHDYYSYWRIVSIVLLVLHVFLYCKLTGIRIEFINKALLYLQNYVSPLNILGVYLLLINIVTFILFYIDKHRAGIPGKWRISVATLLGMALIGGSIGALIGMLLLRHKTLKQAFVIGIPLILIMQGILIFSFLTRIYSLKRGSPPR